jgi:long-chain fatty acid transport protein
MVGGTTSRNRGLRAVLLFGTVLPSSLAVSAPAAASGFYLQEQSVRGWGRANSGEVSDGGPASLWWNPASIGWDSENSAAFGATAILPSGRISDAGTLIDRPGLAPVSVGGASLMRNPVQKGVLPGSAAAIRLGDKLAVGLAITSPFSFTSDYDPAGWQRYSAIRTEVLTLDIQPSVAFAPNDWLSLGAALNLEYSDAFLSNALPNLAPGDPDARLDLGGKGWDLGWSAGLQLRPVDHVTIGIAYKSAIEHKLDGSIQVSGLTGALAARNRDTDLVVTFSTPWQLIVGARGAVSDRLVLNAQAVRFGWSEFDKLDLGAPVGSSIPQDYKNSWSYAFGLDYRVGGRLILRSGIQFDATPTRDDRRDPRVPDGDRVNYNVGASYRLNHRMTFDAAASYTDFKAVAITRDESFYAGTAAQTDILVAGTASGQRALVVSLGGRLSF